MGHTDFLAKSTGAIFAFVQDVIAEIFVLIRHMDQDGFVHASRQHISSTRGRTITELYFKIRELVELVPELQSVTTVNLDFIRGFVGMGDDYIRVFVAIGEDYNLRCDNGITRGAHI